MRALPGAFAVLLIAWHDSGLVSDWSFCVMYPSYLQDLWPSQMVEKMSALREFRLVTKSFDQSTNAKVWPIITKQ